MSMRLASSIILVSLVLVGSSAAQPLGTDLIVAQRNGDLLRVPASGPISTIGTYAAGGALNNITMDVGNQEVAATVDARTTGGHLLRINLTTGTATTIARGLGRVWSCVVDQNGDYIVGTFYPSPTSLFRVKRDGSSVTSIASFRYAPLFTQDLNTGDWILAHDSNQILRYANDWSRVKATISHSSIYVYNMAHDPQLPAVYIAAADLIQLNTGSNAITTLDTAGPGPGVALRALEVDRAPASSGAMIYAGTATSSNASIVFRYDRTGTNLGTAVATSSSKASQVVFDESRNLGALLTAAPNDRAIQVSFPADWLKSYVVAFSLSGFTPGITLGDGRVIPLNPDALTFLTATRSLPPLILNNRGVLGTGGTAQVQLNLNSLGGAVSGVRLWAVALTIDPGAPLGISQISAPMLFVL